MNKFFFTIVILSLCSCSNQKVKDLKTSIANTNDKFLYTDKNGKFLSRYSTGFKDKDFFTKRTIEVPNKDKDNVLEQSIVISNLGSVKKNVILRPKISQYTVWFEGKKYFSELRLNPKNKSLDLKMVSPEKNWNGEKQFKIPTTNANICFFSQLVECVKVSGFLNSTEAKKQKMGLLIIWEGYPYLNETYSDFPSELFSKAEIEFDSITKDGDKKFNVNVAGQSIFYVVNNKNEFKKMFWVSQGISMLEKSVAKNSSSEESESE